MMSCCKHLWSNFWQFFLFSWMIAIFTLIHKKCRNSSYTSNISWLDLSWMQPFSAKLAHFCSTINLTKFFHKEIVSNFSRFRDISSHWNTIDLQNSNLSDVVQCNAIKDAKGQQWHWNWSFLCEILMVRIIWLIGSCFIMFSRAQRS